MKKAVCSLVILALGISPILADDSLEIKQLEKRIAALEERLDKLEKSTAPAVRQLDAKQMKDEQRAKARKRMHKDREIYSREELREIETLYQVANKNWKTDKAKGKASLLEMVSKYDKANRTGCALLYIGQMSKGKEREDYLKQAIEGYSDCFYGDGVQVGAYARYYLAYHYKEKGENEKAEALFDEIRREYPNAVNHRGKPLADIIGK